MPYLGEIRMFAGNFAPAGWALCQGQTLPISENDALFTLLGTTYGGDGQETFNLPNLAGRLPLHMGTGPSGQTYQLGEAAGVEQVTLTTQQMPIHSHAWIASIAQASLSDPTNHVIAKPDKSLYRPTGGTVGAMASQMIGPAGGSQPHENMQPFLCINFIIALYGVFPQQT